MFKNIFSKQHFSEIDMPYKSIPVNLICPRQTNLYSKEDFLEDLCKSIKQYGLLEPIVVRQLPNGLYEVVCGDRRLKACKIIGLKEIPAIINDASDIQMLIFSYIENTKKRNISFFQEAEIFNVLLSKYDFTLEDISNELGIDVEQIQEKLEINKLSPIIKKIIIDRGLTLGHAREISKLSDENLQFKVLKTICDKGMDIKGTEQLVKNIISNNDFLESKETSENIVVGAFKDFRIFINAINEVVKSINKSGMKAILVQKDKGNSIEINIKIGKKGI